MSIATKLMISATLVAVALPVGAQQATEMKMNDGMMSVGLMMPQMDAEYLETPMNSFEFAARMWRGAEAMVELQEDELGGQIELDGEELAAIIAFVHDSNEQAMFSEKDIPEEIEAMMHHETEDEPHDEGEEEGEEEDHG